MVFMIQKYWKYFAAGSLILLLIFSYVLAMDRQYEKGRRSMAVEISNRLKVEALKQAAEVRQHELKAANTLAERQRELEKEKQDAEKLMLICVMSLTACVSTQPFKDVPKSCPKPLQPPVHLMARKVHKVGSYSENARLNMLEWQKQPISKPPI